MIVIKENKKENADKNMVNKTRMSYKKVSILTKYRKKEIAKKANKRIIKILLTFIIFI